MSPTAEVIDTAEFILGTALPSTPRKRKKLTDEQRKAKFVGFMKEVSRLERELRDPNSEQLAKARLQKAQSKKASVSIQMMTDLLESFGATVVIDHTRAPLTEAKPGESGFGSRLPYNHIWFTENSNAPKFGENGPFSDDCHLYAKEASGYSIATVNFISEVGPLAKKTFHGKSICSGDENFNGNIGAFFALFDVFSQIAFNTEIKHPLQDMFYLMISLCDIGIPLPAAYRQVLELVTDHGKISINDGY